jgi:hypothetical protein
MLFQFVWVHFKELSAAYAKEEVATGRPLSLERTAHIILMT